MSANKAGPTVHVITTAGVLLGGIVWLAVYASHFGTIEFDGPASMGLGIGLIAGGVICGAGGIIYDIKHKEQLSKIFGFFAVSLVVSFILLGALIGNYARNKWDYAAAHKSECQVAEDVRPLACQ